MKLINEVLSVNPDLNYLKNVDIYFFHFRGVKKLIGITLPFFDKIFLLGNFHRPTTVFVIAHELEHKNFQYKNGLLKTIYTLLFNRSLIEKRAVERGLMTLQRLSFKYEYRSYLEWVLEKIKSYKISKNPLKKLFYEIYYKDLKSEF